MIESIFSVGASLATIATAILAFATITAWRRQHKFQRQSETIGDALVLAYQAVDVVRAIRSPIGWSNEGSTRKQFPNESPQETELLNDAFTPVERLIASNELFAKMLTHRYKMMLEFGPDKRDVFKPVLDFKNKLISRSRVAMDYVHGPRSRNRSDETFQKFHDEFEKLRWEQDDNDEINQQMQAMVKALEDLRQTIK